MMLVAERGKRMIGVSDEARRVLGALERLGARSPECAVPDGTIAREARVSVRDVIDLAEELCAMDVAVLATCGTASRDGSKATRRRTGRKGRFLCANPAWVRLYAEKLHRRAKAIHGRAAAYRDLAERMDQKASPDSRGQRRTTELFSPSAIPLRTSAIGGGAFA